MYEFKLNLVENSVDDIEADMLHIVQQLKRDTPELEEKGHIEGYGWQVISFEDMMEE